MNFASGFVIALSAGEYVLKIYLYAVGSIMLMEGYHLRFTTVEQCPHWFSRYTAN
jgi:hypothetical protein